MKRMVVVGAGGFAREVKWLIEERMRSGASYAFAGYVVSDLAKLGPHDSREEVRGDLSWLTENRNQFDALALGIGTPGPRNRVASELEKSFPPSMFPALVHPRALYDARTAQVRHGVFIGAGVIGTVHLEIEAFALVNLACTLGHEAKLGRACVLNPSVNISGGVQVGEGVLVGTGAQVLQYVTLGPGAIVGAGAVVTKDVKPGATVVGIPARPLSKEV